MDEEELDWTRHEEKELDPVALTCDLPEHGLKRGDVGIAVLVHGEGEGFEVEFVGYDGHTVAADARIHPGAAPARKRHSACA